MDHWSNGLNNKGRRDQSCHTTHQSRVLDRGLRVCSGQTDHQSNRLNENPEDQYGQADYRSTEPDKGSKCYSGVLAHRSTRPDNSSGEHLGPQGQQNNIRANEKISSHRVWIGRSPQTPRHQTKIATIVFLFFKSSAEITKLKLHNISEIQNVNFKKK